MRPHIRGRCMLFLKGCVADFTWPKIEEGSYQRLKGVVDAKAMCDQLDIEYTRTQIHIRLGRAALKTTGRHARMYCEEITDERDYVSNYVLSITDEAFTVTQHMLYHTVKRWTIPWAFLSPTIFSYYASPNDCIYEDILDRLCTQYSCQC